jgi:hypothetical protein
MLVVGKMIFFLLPSGEKEGHAWEDEGGLVLQLQDLNPLTLPLPRQRGPPSPRWGEGKPGQRMVKL